MISRDFLGIFFGILRDFSGFFGVFRDFSGIFGAFLDFSGFFGIFWDFSGFSGFFGDFGSPISPKFGVFLQKSKNESQNTLFDNELVNETSA